MCAPLGVFNSTMSQSPFPRRRLEDNGERAASEEQGGSSDRSSMHGHVNRYRGDGVINSSQEVFNSINNDPISDTVTQNCVPQNLGVKKIKKKLKGIKIKRPPINFLNQPVEDVHYQAQNLELSSVESLSPTHTVAHNNRTNFNQVTGTHFGTGPVLLTEASQKNKVQITENMVKRSKSSLKNKNAVLIIPKSMITKQG